MRVLLHSAHDIMYVYGGPQGAAAPLAPTDAQLVTDSSSPSFSHAGESPAEVRSLITAC